MLNPGQIFKNHSTLPAAIKESALYVRNSSHIVLDAFQNTKSKWDEPINIPPVLYAKFNVPAPSAPKQCKNYPKSVLDYIRRSYQKCKDQNQKTMMEKQLREIVRSFESDFNQVDWQAYPLPTLEGAASKPMALRAEDRPQLPRSRIQEIRRISGYNIVQEQKPSKALEIAKKKLEKLEQKLNRTGNQPQQKEPQPKEVFIGFTNAPIVKPKPAPTISTIARKFPPPPTPPTQAPKEMTKQQMKQAILKIENTEAKKSQAEKQHKKQAENKQRSSMKAENSAKIAPEEKRSTSVRVSKKQLQMLEKLKQHDEQIQQIARRFNDFNKLKQDNLQRNPVDDDSSEQFEQAIVGKSQSIEKPYLRITGRPNPDTVRPEHILKKAMKFFIDKYNKDRNYEYLISQLRSVRQDLTVQHIKNDFTVQVYEYNLETSLYEKDIPQFKHCQTTLWQLYCQGYIYTEQSRADFVAHQMLTLILEDKSQELEYMLTRINDQMIDLPQIQTCLKIKRQLVLGNYRAFFDFYGKQHKFVRSLIDLYIDKLYVRFLLMLCKTCGERVPLSNIDVMVGKSSKRIRELIESEGGVIDKQCLLLKPSYEQLVKSEHLVTKKVTVLMN